jgi:hypothetical protein
MRNPWEADGSSANALISKPNTVKPDRIATARINWRLKKFPFIWFQICPLVALPARELQNQKHNCFF